MVSAELRTEAGFRIGESEPEWVDGNGTRPLAQAVLEALDRSEGVTVPTPARDANLNERLTKAAGVKSWSTFFRGCRAVLLGADASDVQLMPTRRNRGGFDHLPDESIYVSRDPADLERGLLSALEISR